ncbi:uncharacterized protein PHALS_03157 [Plasmopara halstedii]|uniref:Uncharacterized protein n=1 Tax=Plasmopara halstedii TaxID=4781 RepID=A0A0P1A8T1_PLAHL|nr:uncharacterized protein PHALS_03157 [Plasmopara halstedii]CEG36612.1 hypothetical protein PHALS_03157 [Plasmopara halstedii]|eukprot:XP_024572981.1 hypothetical protein PHALS_03157 [Plasmopara halstedii]
MPVASSTRKMTTKQINRIIEKLDWKEVEAALFSAERDASYPAFEDGKIYIVELPTGLHETFSRFLDVALLTATGTFDQHLESRGSAYVGSLRKFEPDCSFGPAPGVGSIFPVGMSWSGYHTKADLWRKFPGVEYNFCICLSPVLRVRQYKLYTVDDAIVTPTIITFNSRHLLGLVIRRRIPPGFSRPNFVFVLFPLIERLIREVVSRVQAIKNLTGEL